MKLPIGLAVLALLATGVPCASQAPGQEPPTFRTGVELVAVDVSVTDREGRPVRDLTIDDFTVQVDGQVRTLVSAEFVPLGATARTAVVGPKPTHYSTNAGAAGGRLIIFVVDRGNIRRGEGRPLLAAAKEFIERLEPADRVALAVIPDAGPYVDFTGNRESVRSRLAGLLGSATPPLSSYNIGLSESLAIAHQDLRTLDRVVGRECYVAGVMAPPPARGVGRDRVTSDGSWVKACELEVRAEARLLYGLSRQQAFASLTALRNLLARLALSSGPKTLVLLSEGLFVDDRELGDLRSAAAAAAAADTTLYVLGLDMQDLDASTASVSPTFDDDRVLRRHGLEMLAGMTRGRVFGIAAGAGSAFDRIARELSGYYLLSFEPAVGDRDGRERTIDVDVRRPGVDVRARRHFLVDRGTSSRPTKDVLAEILRTPLPATELLLRTATFVYPGDGRQLRVVIAAEIEGATAAGSVPCGFSLTDANGQVVGAELEGPTAAAQARGDAHTYLASFTLDPGKYLLKLAAIDALGRRGSVEHGFEARLAPAGQLRVGDLMLADAPPGGQARDIRPAIDTRMTSDELIGYLEISSDVPALLDVAEVALEVAASESGPALARAETRIETPTLRRRVAEGRLPTDALPPGEYVARAVVTSGRRQVAQVARPFRVERPLAASRAPVSGATARAGSPRLRGPAGLAGVESFAAERVLQPEVVGYFLDRLPRDAAAPLAGPVAAAATAAREGRFGEIETALAEAGDTDLTAAFLRGLARLARGELDPAAQEFRRTLRLSTEFFPAAFYLGACHAAGGRDEEAAGAWQTSLVSDTEAPFVYELLGDALLRLEEGQQAVDILGEARGLWPADDRFVRRLAIAHAEARQHAEALGALDRYLEKHADDRDAWLLGAWLYYDARLSGRPLADAEHEAPGFARYRERYAALDGAQIALVDQWERAMAKRRTADVRK